MGIESNSSTAATYTQGIMDGANGFAGLGEATKDDQTTLQGNAKAGSSISNEASASSQISEKLKTFITLINSVASEFEAVDSSIATSIDSSASGGDSEEAPVSSADLHMYDED